MKITATLPRRWAALVAATGVIGFMLGGCSSSSTSGTTTPTYTVGGTVTGLTSGTQLTLLDNGGNALAVSAVGSFQFSAAIASGSQYAVTVGTQPVAQTCSVNRGSGTIFANVTNVTVICSTSTYTVGGSVTALPGGGSVVLKNNGTDPLTMAATGSFTFPNAVAYGASYSVTTYAPGELCTVTNGSGTASADVTNVSVSCAAGVETILHSFAGGTDGATPIAGLVMDSSGNLYGTTYSYGSLGGGTVFKLTPGTGGAYTETILHSFAGGTDGANPYAGLVMDSSGNLYGTTFGGGGSSSYGTVFRLTPATGGSYIETILHSFAGGTDGANPYAGLVMDSSGNLYGTTESGGGSSNHGTVFKLTPGTGGTYTETILNSFAGGTDGVNPYAGVVMDSSGNLYGTTEYGGSSNSGTVFKLTPGTGGTYTETILHSFAGGTNDGSYPFAGLVMDSSGNLYGTTQTGSSGGNGTVFEIN